MRKRKLVLNRVTISNLTAVVGGEPVPSGQSGGPEGYTCSPAACTVGCPTYADTCGFNASRCLCGGGESYAHVCI